jgi:beta-galactosidase GanA
VAYYIGTMPEGRYLEMELSSILAEAGVRPVLDCARSVWALKRTSSRGDVIFLLNPTSEAECVSLKGKRLRDVLDGSEVDEEIKLEPYGIRVLTV